MLIARRQPMNGFYNDGLAGCACDSKLGTGDYVQLQGMGAWYDTLAAAAKNYFVGQNQIDIQNATAAAVAKSQAGNTGAPPAEEGMDPTTKTLLIVGGVAVAGGLLYILTQR